jgi:hypothetical protein
LEAIVWGFLTYVAGVMTIPFIVVVLRALLPEFEARRGESI